MRCRLEARWLGKLGLIFLSGVGICVQTEGVHARTASKPVLESQKGKKALPFVESGSAKSKKAVLQATPKRPLRMRGVIKVKRSVPTSRPIRAIQKRVQRSHKDELVRSPLAHAILLNGGGSPRINYYSHVLYLRMMRRVLQELDVPDMLIDIFSSDGMHPGRDQAIVRGTASPSRWLFAYARELRFFPRRHQQINTRIRGKTLRPARRSVFAQHMKKVAQKTQSSHKPVMLFVTDHGGRNRKRRHHRDNTISMWKESMSVTELHKALRPFKKRRVVFVMSQCFSGSFTWSIFRKPGLLGVPLGNRCGFMATLPDRYSYGCFPETRLKKQVGHAYRYILAMRNAKTFDAAHQHVLLSDLTPDVPHRTSDGYLYALLQGDAKADGESPARLVDRLLRKYQGQTYQGMQEDLLLMSRLAARFSLTRPMHLKALTAQRKTIKKRLRWIERAANMWRGAFRTARGYHLRSFYKKAPRLYKRVQRWSKKPHRFFRSLYRSPKKRRLGWRHVISRAAPCCSKTQSTPNQVRISTLPPRPGRPSIGSPSKRSQKTKIRTSRKKQQSKMREALKVLRRLFKKKRFQKRWDKQQARRLQRRLRNLRRRVRRRARRRIHRIRRLHRGKHPKRRQRSMSAQYKRALKRLREMRSARRTIRALEKGFVTYVYARPKVLRRLRMLRQKERAMRSHAFWIKTQLAALKRMEILFYRIAGRLLLEHDKHPDFRAYRTGLNNLIQCEKTRIAHPKAVLQRPSFKPLSFSLKGLPLPSWFGISFRAVGGRSAALPKGAVEVDSVYLNTPAKYAGLRPGDIIVSVGGEQLREPFEIRERVMLSSSRHATPMLVLRKGRIIRVNVRLKRLTEPPTLKLAPILGRSFSHLQTARVLSTGRLASRLQGKVSLLFFWATWCGPCKVMLPDLRRWQRTLGHKGLKVFTVSNERPATLRKWLRAHPKALPFVNLYDTRRSLFRTFRIQGTPTVFLIKEGKILFKHVGFLKLKRLEKAIRKALQ